MVVGWRKEREKDDGDEKEEKGRYTGFTFCWRCDLFFFLMLSMSVSSTLKEDDDEESGCEESKEKEFEE